MKKIITVLVIAIFPGCLTISCNKKFDEPPLWAGPDIRANLSIRDLRNMHVAGSFQYFQDEFIIAGTVIADDREDNFYKSVVLQDSTAGMTIRLDGFGLYNFYPVGMKIFVKLKGLWMGDYAGMVQLGAGLEQSGQNSLELIAIPQTLFGRFLIAGGFQDTVIPKPVRIDQLNDSLQSCLVKLSDVEIPTTDTGKPYGDAVNKLSVNRTVRSCTGGTAYLRTSGFASFASTHTPRGNGTITAVYSVFRTEKQLLLRDTADVQLTGLRCTGAGSKLLLYEDFENTIPNTDIAGIGRKNIPETGAKPWQAKLFANNKYAELSAFATSQPVIISWLIMPPVNLGNSANEVLSFLTKDGFDNGASLQVYASTNYDGGSSPWKAKWVALKAVVSKGAAGGFGNDWVPSGKISLNSFSGTVYIAFRYEGADPANPFDKRTTSFQLDEVRVEGN
jgi:hypothetical protein